MESLKCLKYVALAILLVSVFVSGCFYSVAQHKQQDAYGVLGDAALNSQTEPAWDKVQKLEAEAYDLMEYSDWIVLAGSGIAIVTFFLYLVNLYYLKKNELRLEPVSN